MTNKEQIAIEALRKITTSYWDHDPPATYILGDPNGGKSNWRPFSMAADAIHRIEEIAGPISDGMRVETTITEHVAVEALRRIAAGKEIKCDAFEVANNALNIIEAHVGSHTDDTKLATELKRIASVRPGLEQDIRDLARHWPKNNRGALADRSYYSLIERALNILGVADKALADYSEEK